MTSAVICHLFSIVSRNCEDQTEFLVDTRQKLSSISSVWEISGEIRATTCNRTCCRAQNIHDSCYAIDLEKKNETENKSWLKINCVLNEIPTTAVRINWISLMNCSKAQLKIKISVFFYYYCILIILLDPVSQSQFSIALWRRWSSRRVFVIIERAGGFETNDAMISCSCCLSLAVLGISNNFTWCTEVDATSDHSKLDLTDFCLTVWSSGIKCLSFISSENKGKFPSPCSKHGHCLSDRHGSIQHIHTKCLCIMWKVKKLYIKVAFERFCSQISAKVRAGWRWSLFTL
jgi:hypothetical protein